MITLEIKISGAGPARFNFSSGLIATVHLNPPPDGSSLGVTVDHLKPNELDVSTLHGVENSLRVDMTEGPDPVWLAFTIDCTSGGSVGVGFNGSPTVRVNAGSFLGLEYNNGNPGPAPTQDDFS